MEEIPDRNTLLNQLDQKLPGHHGKNVTSKINPENQDDISATSQELKLEEAKKKLREDSKTLDLIVKTKTLKGRNTDSYNSLLWLRENTSRFKGVLYEPVLISLNLMDRSYQQLFNDAVPEEDQHTFIFEQEFVTSDVSMSNLDNEMDKLRSKFRFLK